MKKGWEVKKLEDLVDIKRGGSPRPIKKFLTNDDINGINWIKISDATASGKYIYETKQKILPEGISKSRFVKSGSFLLSNSMSFGRPYILKTDGCIHDGWLVLENLDDSELDKSYLYLILGSKLIFEQFNDLASGSTVRNLNTRLVKSVKIPLPPLSEQQAIVTKLDQVFTAIDQAMANVEQNIANAEELFQSKLDAVFSQTGEGDDLSLPKGWEEKKLDKVCVLQRGFDLPKRLRKKGNIPLVSSSGIIDSHNELKVKKNGVVTGRSGSIGNVFYIEQGFWPLNTTLFVKEFYNNNPKYIYYLLRNFDLKKYASGSGVPTLNRNFVHSELVKIKIDKNEQIRIVNFLDKLELQTLNLKQKYQQKLNSLEELKQSFLEKAFRGELV